MSWSISNGVVKQVCQEYTPDGSGSVTFVIVKSQAFLLIEKPIQSIVCDHCKRRLRCHRSLSFSDFAKGVCNAAIAVCYAARRVLGISNHRRRLWPLSNRTCIEYELVAAAAAAEVLAEAECVRFSSCGKFERFRRFSACQIDSISNQNKNKIETVEDTNATVRRTPCSSFPAFILKFILISN